MPNELRDPGLKWRRGCAHFAALEQEWARYTGIFNSGLEVTHRGDEVVLSLASLSQPPGAEWSVIIGDCVQNFRAALDHMVWMLAPVNVRRTSPASLEFPIFSTATGYAADSPRRIQSLPAAAQRVIESVQPFQQGPTYASNPLWQLHELSNTDKHRRLHIGDVSLEAVIVIRGSNRVRTTRRAAPPATRARAGMELARLDVSEVNKPGAASIQPAATLTVAFDDSSDVTGEGVVGTLRSIRDTVGNVLDQLDPFVGII